MNLLSGITGFSRTISEDVNPEIESAFGETDLSSLNEVHTALAVAGSRISNLLDASETVDQIKPDSQAARQLGRVLVAQSLIDLDLPAEMAVEATAGLESESADVGLEAFSTIKDYVAKAIAWIQSKWLELKRFVAKYWNKYFGDVERLKKAWVGVQEKSASKRDGFTLEKNSKIEFGKGSDCFFTSGNSAVKASELATGATMFKTIAAGILETLQKYEVAEMDPDSVLAGDGKSMKSDQEVFALAGLGSVFKAFNTAIAKKPIPKDAPAKFAELNGDIAVCTSALLGRKRLYIGSKNVADDAAAQMRSFRVGLGDLTEGQKAKDKVTMEALSLDDMDAICEANIELLDSLIELKRSKHLDKAQEKLDKATKALDKWKKKAPGEDEPMEARSAYRGAVKVATAYFDLARTTLVTMPLEFCTHARQVSLMQKVLCDKTLPSYKKD